MIKLIACDLDGTLLNGAHDLEKADACVIEDVMKAGIKFMIATGRSYDGAKDLIQQHGIICDYVVLNGAMIRTQEEGVVYEVAMKSSMLNELMQLLQEEDMCFHMYTKEGTVTPDAKRFYKEALAHMMRNGLCEDEAKQMLEQGKFGLFDVEIQDMKAYLAQQPTVYKIELFAVHKSQQEYITNRLRAIEGIEITNSVADNVEITCVDAQKGRTLWKYCKAHDIKEDEVLVFGDSLNDFNMLSTFPNSFAVSNAMPEIKKVAGYVTDTNINHGVIQVLTALLKDPKSMNFLNSFKKNTL